MWEGPLAARSCDLGDDSKTRPGGNAQLILPYTLGLSNLPRLDGAQGHLSTKPKDAILSLF